mgnify:CR=1 FL=1|tara:strand:- start:447 stop:638 length:192 start_codon:yes stop_codon:yes gene_type:complete
MEQEEKNYLKTELLNELVSVVTVMEEIFKYHPENPDKIDIVKEYETLQMMKDEIETELESLEE